MGRPSKNNVPYFSHDNNMRNDLKIKALRMKYGLEGYAVYNMLLECLCEADLIRIDIANPINLELMAGDFSIQKELLEEIIKYCIGIDLFQQEDSYLLCRQLESRLKPVFDKRKVDLMVLRSSKCTSPAVSAPESTQSKVKYSKEKNIKEIPCGKGSHASPDPRIKQVIDAYYEVFQKKFGCKPTSFKGGRDAKILQSLLKNWTLEQLQSAIKSFLQTDDQFFKKNGYDMPRFETYLNGLKVGAYQNTSTQSKSPYKTGALERQRAEAAHIKAEMEKEKHA